MLFLIDLFLPWNKACADSLVGHFCASANGWHRFGFLAGLLAIAIIVIEIMAMMGTREAPSGTVMLGLSVGLLVSTILRILLDNEFIAWGAWVGLVLSLAIAYGGWLRYQAAPGTTTATGGPTAPPPAS